MPIVKYDPFEFAADFPAGMRLFQDTFNRLLEPSAQRPWAPAVDIMETDNELVLKADIPDVELKDVEIQLENGTLSIKGQRKFERDKHNGGYHRIERSYGSFARFFTVPDTVDAEKVAAAYKNGVLTVTLPKKEVAKPKQIKVEVKAN